MLDVHPPEHTPHSWKEFSIHIATICVGLLIAIGLEQSVEALHHHHQRRELETELHAEAQRNLDLVHGEITFAGEQHRYIDRCIEALATAKPSGDKVVVTMPVNDVALPAGMLISPSQSTWSVARSAGTIALLPAEEAKVYARLDLAADFEQASETNSVSSARDLVGAQLRDHLAEGVTGPVTLTTTQRDDLLYAYGRNREVAADLEFRLAILEGAIDAVLANVHTLEDMYPYQQRAIVRENAIGMNARAHDVGNLSHAVQRQDAKTPLASQVKGAR